MKLDLHIHTLYSPDAVIDIDDIKIMLKKKGLDGVAITDHDTIKGALTIMKNINKYVIIPGIEMTTKYGHILVLNIIEDPPRTDDLDEIREFAEDRNGLLVIAHPYSTFRKSRFLDMVLNYVDAIEVANALDHNVDKNYVKLTELRHKYGKGATAGSDSHIPDTIGNAYVEIDAFTVDEVLENIRKGEVKVYFKKTSTFYRVKKLFCETLHRARLYKPVPP